MTRVRAFECLALGCVVLAAGALTSSCAGGSQGDTCLNTADCALGYHCRTGVCVYGAPALAVYESTCVLLDCIDDDDCLGDLTCSSGACVCSNDDNCPGGLLCGDGACVECLNDDDCNGDDVCAGGFCTNPCEGDHQCPAFFSCDEGHCNYAGCQNDRECVRALSDATAICDRSTEPGTCKIPCTSSFDCSPGGAHSYNDLACSGGFCKSIGCADDAECHAEYGDTEYGVECRELD